MTLILIVVMLLAAMVSGWLLWDRLPAQMASHWNAADEVDGYLPRFWGVFLMPILTLVMAALFLVIPRIDPLRDNIARFRGVFNWFIVIVIAFLLYVYALTLIYNLGIPFRMSRMMLPAMGVLLYFAGELVRQARRNWFIGIRTPWTLSDERVWAETHRFGSLLFKAAGVLIFISAFLPGSAAWVVLGMVLLIAFVPLGYSYWLYERYRREACTPQGKEERE
jgi:uncharacterized membrane protein